MKRIRPNYHNLHVMKDARRKLRRAILANSDKELLDTVCECSLNVLQGNVKLSNCKKRKLRKFRRQLRTVADRHVPLARKKELIIQSGGFLVPLFSLVPATIASLIYEHFKSSLHVTQDVSRFP